MSRAADLPVLAKNSMRMPAFPADGSPTVFDLRVNRRDSIPMYVQIADGLKSLLQSGALAPGSVIPPERVLCDHFGVSRMTLRAAYDVLEREGLIECDRGRGTFVSLNQKPRQYQQLRSFTEEILMRGETPSSKLLSCGLAEPTPEAAKFLGLSSGEQVYRVQRVRLSNAVPLAIELIQLPSRMVPRLDQFDLGSLSLYALLEREYRIEVDSCVEEISAARPKPIHRKLLDVMPSGAILIIKRKVHTQDGQPVELAISDYRADLYTAIFHSTRAKRT